MIRDAIGNLLNRILGDPDREIIMGECCGDIEANEAVALCECEKYRAFNKPHGYVKPKR